VNGQLQRLAAISVLGAAGCSLAYAETADTQPAGAESPAPKAGVVDAASLTETKPTSDASPKGRDETSQADGGSSAGGKGNLDGGEDGGDGGSPDAAPAPWVTPAALITGRCITALCFNANHQVGWLGIEPLVELPIGEEFTLNSGGLASYINNTDLKISFSAGLRVWILQDWLSFSVYISQPVTPKDSKVRLMGSTYEYPAAYVRRPYPGFALGLFFDTLWIGLDRDELRNGSDGSQNINPQYPPNALVAGVWSWTIAIQPFTTFRTGLGTALSNKK